MAQHGIDDPAVYARFLKTNPEEPRILFHETRINVTRFLSDPAAFVALKSDVLRELMAELPQDVLNVQRHATDLDEGAIDLVRAGLYPPNIAQDVLPERLRRCFLMDWSCRRRRSWATTPSCSRCSTACGSRTAPGPASAQHRPVPCWAAPCPGWPTRHRWHRTASADSLPTLGLPVEIPMADGRPRR